jgi:hypothetical protein
MASSRSTDYTAFNAASAVGNIIAPYLFNAKDAPGYKREYFASLHT